MLQSHNGGGKVEVNIEDKILDARRRYIFSTGKNANYIYVGDEEYQDMMDIKIIKFNRKHYDKETKLIGAAFFAGMKVIRVRQNSHLNITT